MSSLKFLRLFHFSRNFNIGRRMMETGLAPKKCIKYSVTNDVAIIKMDDPTSKVNRLSFEFEAELWDCFKKGLKDVNVKSIVIISAKPDCYIAGADLHMLDYSKTEGHFENLSIATKKKLNILEQSTKPVVAAIMGCCIGGGLEIALACHYRIAVKTKETTFSLPEIFIGIIPGAGGTQRIFKCCNDYLEALQIMLTGKNVRADKATKLGMVDQLIEPLGPGLRSPDDNTLHYLEALAVGVAHKLSTGELKRSKKKLSLKERIVTTLLGFEWGRKIIFDKVRSKVMRLTYGLYPAQLKIIELCEVSAAKGIKAGYELETKFFGQLAITKESNALLSLFFGRKKCSRNRFGNPSKPASHVTVLGAGLMGSGITQVNIEMNIPTSLKDISYQALAKGQDRIQMNLLTDVRKKKYTSFEADRILSKLHSTINYEDIKATDIVIEAVFEDISLKHAIIKEAEAKLPSNIVFASNTSALPIHKIAAASSRLQKVIGMHYFSPVDKMPLLEIVITKDTDEDTKAMAVDLGLRQGKVVIVVSDGPGFYTTRILTPTMSESIRLLQEGVRPTELDLAGKKFGWPVGMATLADEVGIDVSAHVAEDLSVALGDRMKGGNVAILKEMVAAGLLGRKVNEGCYTYTKKSKSENSDTLAIINKYRLAPPKENTTERIQWRPFVRLVNEAVLCLQEGILSDPVDGDMGAVFGLGFPPFLGGPFRYLDNHGAEKVVKLMEEYGTQYGEEFRPCDLLYTHAKNPSKKFYGTFTES